MKNALVVSAISFLFQTGVHAADKIKDRRTFGHRELYFPSGAEDRVRQSGRIRS